MLREKQGAPPEAAFWIDLVSELARFQCPWRGHDNQET
jgi:hypothetical protein